MEVFFQNRYIEKLYTHGSTKKYPLPKQVLDSFFEVVAIIEAAKNIYDFRCQPSLKFERMVQTKNRYSFRLHRIYRPEVTIDWKNEEKTIGLIYIEEISKHYQ